MFFRRSDQRDAYRQALGELSDHGEPPGTIPRDLRGDVEGPRRPAGFYGEWNWKWDGVQRGPFSGRGPKGWRRPDERIREDVCEALAADGDLDASDVTVDVLEGEVTLEGTVLDRSSKRRAEDVADRRSGVRDVHNRLRIAR